MQRWSQKGANASTENGDTHREAEANTVQKAFIEGVQLCLSHYSAEPLRDELVWKRR